MLNNILTMVTLQYGKTKAEREQVIIMGPKRYRFDGESTMDKFTSEHPVQMSQVGFFTCQMVLAINLRLFDISRRNCER